MRTAIVCNERMVPRWLHAALKRLVALNGLDLLVVYAAPKSSDRTCLESARGAEAWWLQRIPGLLLVDMPGELARVSAMCRPGAPPVDLDLVVDCHLDAGAYGEAAPRLGTCTLAIEGGVGLDGVRLAADAFRRRERYLRFSFLVGPADTRDDPRIIHEGAVGMAHSFAKSLDILFDVAGYALVGAVQKLALSSRCMDEWPKCARPPTPKRLGAGAIAACHVHSIRRFGARVVRGIYFEKWNVGLCSMPIEGLLGLSTVPAAKWLPELPGFSFLADPFSVPDHPGLFLAEYYDEKRRRGCIVSLACNGAGELRMSIAIDREFHLSYPYIFRDGGNIYCVPEAAQSGRLTLFRLVPGDGQWQELGTLIEFPAVDPTVFYHEGSWWLFCTALAGAEFPPATTKLYVWFAEALTGPWRQHPLNPVKTDVRSSRPAGAPFLHGGRLYRPTQDCSGTYGGAVSLVEILKLSETVFEERVVGRLGADPASPYPSGFHTAGATDHGSVVDGKRWVLSSRLPWIRVLRLLRERMSPLAG